LPKQPAYEYLTLKNELQLYQLLISSIKKSIIHYVQEENKTDSSCLCTFSAPLLVKLRIQQVTASFIAKFSPLCQFIKLKVCRCTENRHRIEIIESYDHENINWVADNVGQSTPVVAIDLGLKWALIAVPGYFDCGLLQVRCRAVESQGNRARALISPPMPRLGI
jgi:hypothetical protein